MDLHLPGNVLAVEVGVPPPGPAAGDGGQLGTRLFPDGAHERYPEEPLLALVHRVVRFEPRLTTDGTSSGGGSWLNPNHTVEKVTISKTYKKKEEKTRGHTSFKHGTRSSLAVIAAVATTVLRLPCVINFEPAMKLFSACLDTRHKQ